MPFVNLPAPPPPIYGAAPVVSVPSSPPVYYGSQAGSAPPLIDAPIRAAPSVPPSYSIPPAAGAIPAAAVPASGSSILLPAALLAAPLALAAGDVGENPIANTQNEMDMLRRAGAPVRNPDFAKLPGTPNPIGQPPAGKSPVKPLRPPVPKNSGVPGNWQVDTRVDYASRAPALELWSHPGNANDFWSVGVDAQGSNILQNGKIAYKTWTLPIPQGGGTLVILGVQFQAAQTPQPPNPANPNPQLPGQQNPTQKSPQTPNPANPVRPPNPANPQLPASQNPSQKLPETPNPAKPSTPNPSSPKVPETPNPANPNQLPASQNPSQKLPETPNPANPDKPGPLVPGPLIPGIPIIGFDLPGQLLPQIPGSLVPSLPNPLRPIRKPNSDPCIDDPCIADVQNQTKLEYIVVKKFIGCNVIFGKKVYFANYKLNVPAGSAAAWKLALDNQADILAMSCDALANESIAAVPDWWQVRLGADRPQLIVQFAAKFSDGTWDKAKYVISIPHWRKSEALTLASDFPTYRKGQHQGVMVLPDNSKLIVNAFSEAEAQLTINKLALGIPLSMVSEAVTTIGVRRGRELSSVVVYPRYAKYFPTGQQNLMPLWTKKL